MIKIKYFYLIDLLRWIAAMGVLIHHYSYYFLIQKIDIKNSKIMNLITENAIIGSYGVWFFWCISGFVFTNILVNTKSSLYDFSIKRFSRLYPLHFITLLIITMLEIFSVIKFGNYQLGSNIYDVYHFILNLFFISDWGLQHGFSFNHPIWSVSIEIPIYFIFFFILINIKKNYLTYIIIILIISKIILHSDYFHYHLKACFFFFMFGSFLYLFCLKFQKYIKSFIVLSILGILSFPFWVLIENIVFLEKFKNFVPTTLILFASLICFAFFLEDKYSKIAKRISFLGNASYAIYLTHLPIQVFLLILSSWGFFEMEIFTSLSIFLLYLFVINIIGIFSYIYFENPIRKLTYRYLKDNQFR